MSDNEDNILDFGLHLENDHSAVYRFPIPINYTERVVLVSNFQRALIGPNRVILDRTIPDFNLADYQEGYSGGEESTESDISEDFSDFDPLEDIPEDIPNNNKYWWFNPHLNIYTTKENKDIDDWHFYFTKLNFLEEYTLPLVKHYQDKAEVPLGYSKDLNFFYSVSIPSGVFTLLYFAKKFYFQFKAPKPPGFTVPERVRGPWNQSSEKDLYYILSLNDLKNFYILYSIFYIYFLH